VVALASEFDILDSDTDERGFFHMGPIPPGEYTVFCVLDIDPQPHILPGVDVQVVAGETIEIALRPAEEEPHILRGRVFLGGVALAECEIMAFNESQGMIEGLRATETDNEGSYTLELTGSGAHLFYFEPDKDPRRDPAAPQRWIVGQNQHTLDFQLPLGEITGRVLTPEGGGASGISVIAFREDGYLDQVLPFDDGSVRSAKDGRYRLTLLDDGLYTVAAYGKRAYSRCTGIRVFGGVVDDIDLEPRSTGRVEGIVFDADGQPVDRALVFARDDEGELLWGHTDDTDSKGRFGFTVPAGSLTLFARMWGAASPATDSLTVHAGKITQGIRLHIVPAARLTVQTQTAGQPTPATIRVYNEQNHEVSRAKIDLEGMAGILKEPLSASQRVIGPLPPGTYRVTATFSNGRTKTKAASLGTQDLTVTLSL